MKVRWYHVTLAVVAMPVLLLMAYSALVWWDISRVRSVCASAKPGTSVPDLWAMVRGRGLSQYLPDPHSAYPNGIEGDKPGTWFFAIPAGTTMGDVACGITHDGKVIVEGRLLEW